MCWPRHHPELFRPSSCTLSFHGCTLARKRLRRTDMLMCSSFKTNRARRSAQFDPSKHTKRPAPDFLKVIADDVDAFFPAVQDQAEPFESCCMNHVHSSPGSPDEIRSQPNFLTPGFLCVQGKRHCHGWAHAEGDVLLLGCANAGRSLARDGRPKPTPGRHWYAPLSSA